MKRDIKPRDKNYDRHGYWEVYHDNGYLWYKGCYIHGKRYGLWETYYDNGQFAFKGFYIHGKRHGYCEGYWDSGELWFKGNYYIGIELYQTLKKKFIL